MNGRGQSRGLVMARKVMRSVLLVVLALAAWPAAAPAAEPPWCGTPEADSASLPDGTDRPIRGQLPAHPVLRGRLHARGHRGPKPRPDGRPRDRPVGARPRHVRRRHQPPADAPGAARLPQLAGGPQPGGQGPGASAAAARPLGRRRQGPDLRPGQHPRRRVRGRRLGDRDDREVRDDAVRRAIRRSTRSSPRGPGLQPDPEPGRPRRRHAPERQRVRPQPRLHDPVAARDARTRSA